MLSGKCHCGAVQYRVTGEPIHQALCHCSDCQRHAGAPMVGWALFPDDRIIIEGQTKEYASSEHGRRQFCGNCGTSLFYRNDQIFPDQTDVQIATLDDPGAIVPQAQIQTAERVGWMEKLDSMPNFERYPG